MRGPSALAPNNGAQGLVRPLRERVWRERREGLAGLALVEHAVDLTHDAPEEVDPLSLESHLVGEVGLDDHVADARLPGGDERGDVRVPGAQPSGRFVPNLRQVTSTPSGMPTASCLIAVATAVSVLCLSRLDSVRSCSRKASAGAVGKVAVGLRLLDGRPQPAPVPRGVSSWWPS